MSGAEADPLPSGIEIGAALCGSETKRLGSRLTAASASRRGVTTPFRGSVIGAPVSRRRPSIAEGDIPGRTWRRRATAPAAAGDAADVPAKVVAPMPFPATTQKAPGARIERFVEEFEKQTTWSGTAGASVH